MVHRRCEILSFKIAANGCEEYAAKFRTVVCKKIDGDLERVYSMVKEQVGYMRRIQLRRRYRSLTFRVSIDQNQKILIVLSVSWLETEIVHKDEDEWSRERKHL